MRGALMAQRKQAYPVAQLTGGVDISVDAAFLVDKASPDLRNVRYDQGLIRKGLGWKQFGTVAADGLPLDGTPILLDSFPLESGTIHYLAATTKWLYRYISATGKFEKKNKQATTGALAMTFVASTKKITRAAGSFVTDGFTEDTIITTDAVLNPGPFTVVTVAALEMVVLETVVDEGPVTKTAIGIIPYTGDEDNRFSTVITLTSGGTEIYVITNGKDPIQKWDGTNNPCIDLPGWSASPVTAKSLCLHKSRLIAGYTVETGTNCPRRVRWSAVGNPEDITGSGSGFVDIVDTSDWVVAVVVLKDRLFVFKERSIWELPYVGGTAVYGAPILKVDGVGTYSQQSIINLGDEIMFYGSDNVYTYDGIDLTPMSKQIYGLLYDTEKKIVNSEKINRSPASYIEELQTYQLCVPTEGDLPALLLTYDFNTESWQLRDKAITAFGYYSVPMGNTWMDLVGDWNAQTWEWMEKKLAAGSPTTLIATADGYLWEDDRKTKSTDLMYVTTKDWLFAHGQRWTEIRIQAKGGPFEVSYSLDEGHTWSSSKTFPYTDPEGPFFEHVLWIDRTSQHIRVKVVCTAQDLDIKWMEPWYIPRKRSKSVVS